MNKETIQPKQSVQSVQFLKDVTNYLDKIENINIDMFEYEFNKLTNYLRFFLLDCKIYELKNIKTYIILFLDHVSVGFEIFYNFFNNNQLEWIIFSNNIEQDVKIKLKQNSNITFNDLDFNNINNNIFSPLEKNIKILIYDIQPINPIETDILFDYYQNINIQFKFDFILYKFFPFVKMYIDLIPKPIGKEYLPVYDNSGFYIYSNINLISGFDKSNLSNYQQKLNWNTVLNKKKNLNFACDIFNLYFKIYCKDQVYKRITVNNINEFIRNLFNKNIRF